VIRDIDVPVFGDFVNACHTHLVEPVQLLAEYHNTPMSPNTANKEQQVALEEADTCLDGNLLTVLRVIKLLFHGGACCEFFISAGS
jgi:hypothetical protein